MLVKKKKVGPRNPIYKIEYRELTSPAENSVLQLNETKTLICEMVDNKEFESAILKSPIHLIAKTTIWQMVEKSKKLPKTILDQITTDPKKNLNGTSYSHAWYNQIHMVLIIDRVVHLGN